MPLTIERKRQLLLEKGLNPDEYEIVDAPSREQTPEPSLSPPVTTSVPKKTSALPAFGRSAASSIAPTAGGLASGALASQYLPLAHIAPPYSEIIAGLGGAIAGGLLTSKAQEAILPETVNQQLAADIAEHPIATGIGGFLPAAAAFNPIRSAQQLASIGAKLPTIARVGTKALTAAEEQAAKNIALNAAINVGTAGAQAGYEQYRSPEPFNVSRFLATTLPAALLNEPTALGRRIGFRSSEVTPRREAAAIAPEEIRPPVVDLYGREYAKQFGDVGGVQQFTAERPLKRAAESAQAIEELTTRESAARQKEYELAVREREAQNALREADITNLEKTIVEHQIPQQPTQRINPQKTSMKRVERATEENLTAPLTGPEQIELQTERQLYGRKFQEETAVPVEQQRLQQEGFERLTQEEAQRRGMKINYSTKQVIGPTGKEAIGSYEPTTRTVNLYKRAAADTPSHEVGHGFIMDLRRSADPKDRALVAKGEEFFRSHPQGPEEGMAEVLGVDGFQRKILELQGNKRDKFIDWYKDFISLVKTKLGMAGQEETMRQIGARQRYEAPYGTRPELLGQTQPGAVAPATAIKFSESGQELPSSQKTEGLTKEPIKGEQPKLEQTSHKGDAQEKELQIKPATELKEAPVTYRGFQEGLPGKFEGFHLYNLKETISPTLVKGSTVTEATLNKEGFKVPDDVKPKFSEESMLNKDEGIPTGIGHKNEFLSESGLPRYHSVDDKTKFAMTDKSIAEGNKVEESIATKLGKASFKAAKEASTEYNKARENAQLTAEREGTKFQPPKATEDITEAFKKAGQKAEEVEAFTRPDVERHQEESALPPAEQQRYSFFRPMASAVDKASSVDTKVAEAANKFFVQRDILEGRYRHVPFNEAVKYNEQERQNVANFIRAKYREEPTNVKLTERETKLANETIRPLMKEIREEANKSGLLVYDKYGKARKGSVSEYYLPDMLSDEALQTITTGTKQASAKLVDDWAKYVAKESEGKIGYQEAKENLSNYVSALTGNKLYSIEFPALRKAAGYGIPEAYRETELLKILQKYGRRSAQDLAYWKHLQSDPYVSAALRLPKAEGGGTASDPNVIPVNDKKEIQDLLKFVFNDFTAKTQPRQTAAIRMVSNALLGPLTGLRDTIQVPVFAVPYIRKFSDLSTFFTAFNNLRQAKIDSVRYGARSGTMDFDRWRTLESPDKITSTFNQLAEAFRKYQGRDLLEQSNRIYAFALGKELAKTNVLRAIQGDKSSQKWLENFGTLKEKEVLKPTEQLLKDEDFLNTLAKNFVDRHQGTYDARGLPAGAFEGPLAPFFALSRWSVEKSNVIYKDVIKPALSGESYIPLLTYTLGSVLTGQAIRELNQLISGKKSAEPTGEESLNKGRLDYYLANLVNLMQLGSWAGIISDGAKVATDLGISHERPRGLSFPLITFATDTIGQGVQDYFTAIDQGADKMDAAGSLILQILKSSVQSARIVHNQLLEPEETARINKFRDIRVFKKLEGREHVPSLAEMRTNPLLNQEERQFKRTTSIKEAAELAPSIIKKTFAKYLATGDIEGLASRLRGLKINNYQTVPNPENKPAEFGRYIKFMRETQGPEAVRQTLVDYFSQQQKNRLKSSLIPRI